MRKGLVSIGLLLAALGGSVGVASAKITPAVNECVNGGGNLAGGQQPDCKGQGQTPVDEPAKNPAGHAPPGQN